MFNLFKNEKNLAKTRAYLIGGGISSLSAAFFLIRDAKIKGDKIFIFEESSKTGGSIRAEGNSYQGYILHGSRIFEEHFVCTLNLMESLPMYQNLKVNAREFSKEDHEDFYWNNGSRIISHQVPLDSKDLELTSTDRNILMKITKTPENELHNSKIEDYFEKRFFKTNFWLLWSSSFAFLPWHGTVEFRRYLIKFLHLFPELSDLKGVQKTKYNQYDYLITPLTEYLKSQGVNFLMGCEVIDLNFKKNTSDKTVTEIHYIESSTSRNIDIHKDDIVLVTNGSMASDISVGTNFKAPTINYKKHGGDWSLWKTLSKKYSDFGDPEKFCESIRSTTWESFTVTSNNSQFIENLQHLDGSINKHGGFFTLKDSPWQITMMIKNQPLFRNQSPNTYVWWGFGLYPYTEGTFIKKRMIDCTGQEILQEILSHLPFTDNELILNTSTVIPSILPYVSSPFMPRSVKDRPQVIPNRSTNLAFLGQFCEIEEEISFTVEYSVRSAMIGVYQLLHLKKDIPKIFTPALDSSVIFESKNSNPSPNISRL